LSGIWHPQPDQEEGREPSCAESRKRGGIAEVLRNHATYARTKGRADSGYQPNDTHPEIESAAAPRDIGDKQGQHHSYHRGTDSIQRLAAHQKRGIVSHSK
jgi:hypothetical protein